QGEQIVFRREGEVTPLLTRGDIFLRGEHNVENVMAAACASFLVGVAPADIAAGVRTFSGVEHRLEFVTEIAGVRFFNDSKATNVDATLKALASFRQGLWVILGGKDKGSDYAPLLPLLQERARAVLLIGAATEKVAAQLAPLEKAGVPVTRCGTLERAIATAAAQAQAGDTVLLAPACASFDQFQNYGHRGRVFKQLVGQLAAAAGDEGTKEA
ncbi:MAG: glutamate ligase domain-containing protein, partial [Terriglobales bacterium]